MGKTRRVTALSNRKTRYSKPKAKTRNKMRFKRGGDKTDGDRLMDALMENTAVRNIDKKPHSHQKIATMFNNVKEDDLYHSILRKKKQLSAEQRRKLYSEAMSHQEDPLPIARLSKCKYGDKCNRKNPVHQLYHRTGFDHPATLVAFSMRDKSF